MSRPVSQLALSPKAQRQSTLNDMERALLGALINLSGEGIEAQQTALKACKPYTLADVYSPTNQAIFSSITGMIAEGLICTPELLSKRLDDRDVLTDVGGLATIARLCMDSTYSTMESIKGLAHTLADESRRRKASELERIIKQGEADNRPLDDVLADAQTLLDSLKTSKAGGFRLNAWRDISTPKPVNWLIKGVLEANSLASLFGASGCGKSFIAVDLSLCIASGSNWHGHKVNQGSVVYFAGEGREGVRRRVAAWLQHAPDCSAMANDYFYLADRTCLLPDDTSEVIESLKHVRNPRLLVLDTLNRTMLGDENSTRDMTVYIQACDKIKAAYPELTILIIHHTGHSTPDRARGSVVLKSSLEAELRASRSEDGLITLVGTKGKDAPPLSSIHFELDSLMLEGWTFNGEPTYSAVLYQSQRTLNTTELVHKPLTGKQLAAYNLLLDMQSDLSEKPETRFNENEEPIVLLDEWLRRCVLAKIAPEPSKVRRDILKPLESKQAVIVRENKYILTGRSYQQEEAK